MCEKGDKTNLGKKKEKKDINKKGYKQRGNIKMVGYSDSWKQEKKDKRQETNKP